MSYPNVAGKHLGEALFHPKDFVKYRKWKGTFPKKFILTYQQETEKYFVNTYRPTSKTLYSLLTIHTHKGVGFVKMAGIGAPNAAAVMEELIALGGKEFINIGTAGGLSHEGVFVCTQAVRDEGTSHHYLAPGKFSYPSEKLTSAFEQTLSASDVTYMRGPTWTIDAPYRETTMELTHYARESVLTVEMEAAALFAVAQFRKVHIASAFVVSDLLGKKWLPKFHRFDVKHAQNVLIDCAVTHFCK